MSDLHYFFQFFHDARWFADRCKRKRNGDSISFVYALKAMEGLIWLVIRLCTDEPKVRDFSFTLDSLLELSMDVIDVSLGSEGGVSIQQVVELRSAFTTMSSLVSRSGFDALMSARWS
jgi:hypothetical protein